MPRSKIFYGWIIVFSCLAISAVLLGGRISFGVFLTPIEAEFGVGRTVISSIYSAYMVLCAFMAVITGWAVDRFGPRRVIFILGLFAGTSLVLTSQTGELWQLYFSFSLLLAMGTGGTIVASISTISPWFRKKRGMATGILSAATGLGAVVLAPLSAFFIDTTGWRNAYLMLGLLTMTVVISLSFLIRRSPQEMGLFPDGERQPKPAPSSASTEAGLTGHGLTLTEALRTSQLKLLMLVFLLFSFCLNMITTHVVPYAIDRGIEALEAATILSVISISGIAGRIIIGRVSDDIGEMLPGAASAVILGVTALGLIWCDNLWKFYLFSVIFGLAWGGYGVIILRLVPDLFEGQNLGIIMGVIDTNFMLGGAIGPALAGYVFDTMQSYNIAFISGFVLIAVSGAALVRLLGMPRKSDAAITEKLHNTR